jgi:hypothetical protein
MTEILTFLLLVAVLLAPFGVVAALATASHRTGSLRWHLGQFPLAAPMVGRLYDDDRGRDADARRVGHDVDAIRTRFEEHPVWPSSGVRGERR